MALVARANSREPYRLRVFPHPALRLDKKKAREEGDALRLRPAEHRQCRQEEMNGRCGLLRWEARLGAGPHAGDVEPHAV